MLIKIKVNIRDNGLVYRIIYDIFKVALMLRNNRMCNVKVPDSVYFVTSVFMFILNIISIKLQQKTENRRINFDAFDLQENKMRGTVFLFQFDNLYSLILADNTVIYFSFVIRYGNLQKYIIAVTAKLMHSTHFKCNFIFNNAY